MSSEPTITKTISSPIVVVTPNTLSSTHRFMSLKLSSRNYLFWHTQLVPFLRGQNLIGYVDGSFLYPPVTIVVSGGTPTEINPAFLAWV